jgi:diguanylate cyclase (GGDEF)-like protein
VNRSLRVLLVLDAEADSVRVLAALRSAGFEPDHRRIATAVALREALRFTDWDLVLADSTLGDLTYASVLRELAADGRDLPLILVAGGIGEELAVEAIKAGAADYVSRDHLDRLGAAVARELRDAEQRRQRRRSDELLRYQACHDDLTGLLNRRTFMERLHDNLVQVRRSRTPASLCFMDLDRFKAVNDRCGHRAGDELLRQLASLMRQAVRESDTLARLGGDEFGLLLRDCGPEQALRVAGDLRDRIRAFRFNWRDQVFDVGISIGIAAVTADAANAAELLSAADMACYRAKADGEGAIRCYQGEDAALDAQRGELRSLSALEAALRRDAFVLVSQPLIQLTDGAGATLGREVLLRMRGDDGALVSPDAFLPIAERNGLLPTLDRWVIHTVLSRVGESARHHQNGSGGLFFVNLSGASLQEPGLADFIREEIDRSGVLPDRLCFEIAETAAVVNLSAAIELSHRLKSLGCHFALDDFGSGLSAFRYVRRLPVDFLRIDGRLVRDMLSDPIERAMVESIQRVGHLMGLRTIAESVETGEHLRVVRALGIDVAQGYAVGRGAPLDEALEPRVGRAGAGGA